MHLKGIEEVVADKGYHSGAVVANLQGAEVRAYISEKKQPGQRHWEGKAQEQQAVYANRRRVKGAYGQGLLRKRGELIERNFAHCYDTGGMRRTHLRGHRNILKRLLIHVGAFNLSLIFRSLLGSGTPRELRNRQSSFLCVLLFLFRRPSVASSPRKHCVSSPPFDRRKNHRYLRYRLRHSALSKMRFRHGLLGRLHWSIDGIGRLMAARGRCTTELTEPKRPDFSTLRGGLIAEASMSSRIFSMTLRSSAKGGGKAVYRFSASH